MVLAAPGCGKTATLARRIRKAHADYGVDYSDMLCLTFTNRAAREMRARALAELSDEGQELFIGNLHRFCIRFLFKNQFLPIDTGIIDDMDQAEIVQELASAKQLGGLKTWEIGSVLGQACELREQKGHIPFAAHSDRGVWDRAEELAVEYISYLRANHLIDYDDILYYTYYFLTHADSDTKPENCRFGWIQVDEVQDLNPLQLAIIDLLAAPDATVVYLGDERQSIFSFMGAKGENLQRIKELCEPNVFSMSRNYRAPVYMLDMLNDYARNVFNLDGGELPQSEDHTNIDNAIVAVECEDKDTELATVASIVKQMSVKCPEEQIGVLVRNNKDVDAVSEALSEKGVRHLAISNRDIFKSEAFKTLYSHFAIIALDTAFTDWIRILSRTGTLPKYSLSRRWVYAMRRRGITPGDLLDYPDSTYIIEFAKAFGKREIVVFDTETTGTDTWSDDIIQIAACRMRGGKVVPGSELNLMIRTDKTIPATLSGGKVNPMVEEYARRASIPPGKPEALMEAAEAFAVFKDYVGDADVVGHNVRFDVDILFSNLSRRAPHLHIPVPKAWDTLSLARRLDPGLRRHNLETLLAKYGIEGVNSHNASDDVAATANLAQYLYQQALARAEEQKSFLANEKTLALASHLRKKYGELYRHTKLLMEGHNVGLPEEMAYVHRRLADMGYIQPIQGLEYMLELYKGLLFKNRKEPYFAQQLANHLQELRTFNEADFYENRILDRNVHVMTIHKAKGLQFDNVVLVDVNGDTFPHYMARKPEEDARLLYVGLSRARKRLTVTYVNTLSRFISSHPEVAEHFEHLYSHQVRGHDW